MDATRAVKRARAGGRAVRWYERPWIFRLLHYRVGDFDGEWELKPGAKAHRTQWVWFDQETADSYRTDEMVYALQYSPFIQQIEASAATRLQIPETKVRGGITQPVEWQGIGGLKLLEMRGGRNFDFRRQLDELDGSDSSVRTSLARMGVYAPGEAPAALPVVVEDRAQRSETVIPFVGRIVSATRPSSTDIELCVVDRVTQAHQVLDLQASWYGGRLDELVGRMLRCKLLVRDAGGVVSCRVASSPVPELEDVS
jgi:hypothetical protein